MRPKLLDSVTYTKELAISAILSSEYDLKVGSHIYLLGIDDAPCIRLYVYGYQSRETVQ